VNIPLVGFAPLAGVGAILQGCSGGGIPKRNVPNCATLRWNFMHPDTPYQGNIIAARPGANRTRVTKCNARVTVRDADGRAEKRWLKNESEYCDVLRGEFGLNLSEQEIEQCVAVTRSKGTGDAPHLFFA
jgi:hypothetical protein